eukprot:4354195-Alexandrium_andersonii.AAC.1
MARPRSSTVPRWARAFPFEVLGQDARQGLLRGARRAPEAAQGRREGAEELAHDRGGRAAEETPRRPLSVWAWRRGHRRAGLAKNCSADKSGPGTFVGSEVGAVTFRSGFDGEGMDIGDVEALAVVDPEPEEAASDGAPEDP